MNGSEQGGDILAEFQKMQNTSDITEVANQLFDLKKREMISELSRDEIRLITRILMIAKIKNLPKWVEGVEKYMTLMISHKRKGRTEVLKAVAGFIERKRGILDRIRGRSGEGLY